MASSVAQVMHDSDGVTDSFVHGHQLTFRVGQLDGNIDNLAALDCDSTVDDWDTVDEMFDRGSWMIAKLPY